MAQVEGIEPSSSVLETDVLPLHHTHIIVVSVVGFEPTTLCSQSKCATRLRYTENLFTCTYLRICRYAHGDETSPPNIVFLSRKIVGTISSTFVSPKKFVVGLGRLELPTSRLSGERSNQLSYRPMLAGAVGFEPTVHCTKNSCLTTWLRSSN